MLRELLGKSGPVAATVAAMLYTQPKKGWAWAVAAGVGAHAASAWLVNTVLGALEQNVALPDKPVEIDKPVAPAEPIPEVTPSEVIDKENNVIQLPTAAGEP